MYIKPKKILRKEKSSLKEHVMKKKSPNANIEGLIF